MLCFFRWSGDVLRVLTVVVWSGEFELAFVGCISVLFCHEGKRQCVAPDDGEVMREVTSVSSVGSLLVESEQS